MDQIIQDLKDELVEANEEIRVLEKRYQILAERYLDKVEAHMEDIFHV